MLIRSDEGHGRLDGNKETEEINHNVCRFNYPQFPVEETTFIPAIGSNIDEKEISERKNDLKKIKQFLIRQTACGQGKRKDSVLWQNFGSLNFNQYFQEVGMFKKILIS